MCINWPARRPGRLLYPLSYMDVLCSRSRPLGRLIDLLEFGWWMLPGRDAAALRFMLKVSTSELSTPNIGVQIPCTPRRRGFLVYHILTSLQGGRGLQEILVQSLSDRLSGNIGSVLATRTERNPPLFDGAWPRHRRLQLSSDGAVGPIE